MIEVVVFGVGLLVVGIGLCWLGFGAIVSPDLSYSRWYRFSEDREDEAVFGEWVVLWLVRIVGVVFVLVGLMAGLFGAWALLNIW